MKFGKRIIKLHPAILVLASFLLTISLGTCLLLLPHASRGGSIALVDALFTATSAVCVTGLAVVDTGSYFTLFGQCVILVLIQVGGLGVMTLSVALFRWLGRSISFRQRMAMQDLFSHTPREDIFNLVKSVVLFTLTLEFGGAILLTIHWSRELPFASAVYTGIFHSISAFCNAGFSLFSDSLMRWSDDFLLNATVCFLIVMGGIGFPVLYELQSWVRRHKKERVRLSVQTKTVLLTTAILISAGALLFGFLEPRVFSGNQPVSHRILVPLFQSITCRTAGFNTVDIGSLREPTLAVMLFLMFFGASPGSCGGGVKTTTLALISAFSFSRVRRQRRVNMFRKSIPAATVTRSLSLILISMAVIGTVLFLLLLAEPENVTTMHPGGLFLPYLFETVSAFGTVGLSMGITAELGSWGKFWIIFMMIIGRMGVLAFSYIIAGTDATQGVEHSEENLMIG